MDIDPPDICPLDICPLAVDPLDICPLDIEPLDVCPLDMVPEVLEPELPDWARLAPARTALNIRAAPAIVTLRNIVILPGVLPHPRGSPLIREFGAEGYSGPFKSAPVRVAIAGLFPFGICFVFGKAI